jgi:tRNA A58 N-methylase Trm61
MFKRIILVIGVLMLFILSGDLTVLGMDSITGTKSLSFESSPLPKTEEEKIILGVLEDMHKNQRWGMMNVPPEDGRLLRLFTEATNAGHVVEIGTSNGYSAIWFCLALKRTGGKLTTFEIDHDRARLARHNFKRAGVEQIVTLIPGGLILAHNMNLRQADPRYVEAITSDPDLETLFLHMQATGVGVTLKKRN